MGTRWEISIVRTACAPIRAMRWGISLRVRSRCAPRWENVQSRCSNDGVPRLAKHLERGNSTPGMGIFDVHPALVSSTCFLLSAERSWTEERTLSEGEDHWWTEPWRWRSKVCGS